ncbi:MAG: hypothetical protein KGV45_00130 [Gammaproteobacteria bacterium]|nr:hypothetical protein [Gammaproteobacteria bacterium]
MITLPAETVKANALRVRVQVHADELNEANEYIVVKAEVQPEDADRISVKATDHNGVTGDYLDGATQKADGSWTFTDDGGDNYGVGMIEAGDQVRVSEEGLAWGWKDNDIYGRKDENTENTTVPDDQWDRVNSATGTRYMGFAPGYDITAITHMDGKDEHVNNSGAIEAKNATSGGKPINWGWDNASKTLTGTVTLDDGTTEKVMDIHIKNAATGKNEVTLYRQIDHLRTEPLAKDEDILIHGQKLRGVEDIVELKFEATGSNASTGESETMKFSVIVEDDSPHLNVIDAEINNTPTVNLLLTLDVSWSMTAADFANGSTQIMRKDIGYVKNNSKEFTIDMSEIGLDPEGWKFYGIKFGNDIADNNISRIDIYDGQGQKVKGLWQDRFNDSTWQDQNTWKLGIDPNKYSKDEIKQFTMKVFTKQAVDPGATLSVEIDGDRATHAKEAFIELIKAYEAKGKIVNAKIVEFASGEIMNYSPWLTGENAQQFLKDGIMPRWGTNYQQALEKMMDTYQNGMPIAQDTIAYFISDGVPSGVNATNMHNFEDTWLQFLADNNIENSYAINVVETLGNKHLNEVAHSSEVDYVDFDYDNGDKGDANNSQHTHKNKVNPNISQDGNYLETEANATALANPDDVVKFLLDTVKPGSATGNSLEAKKGRGKVVSIIGADKTDATEAIDDVLPIFHSQDGHSFIFKEGNANATTPIPKFKLVNGTAAAGDENIVYLYTDENEAHQEGTPFKYAEYITKINAGVLIFDKSTGKYHFEMTSNGVNNNDGKTYSYRVDVVDGDGDRSSARIDVTVDSSDKKIKYTEHLIAQGDHQLPENVNGNGFTVTGWANPGGSSTAVKDWDQLEGHNLEKAKVFASHMGKNEKNLTDGIGVWSGNEGRLDNSANYNERLKGMRWKSHINTREILQIKFDTDQTEIDASFSHNYNPADPTKNTAMILFYKDGKLVGERSGDDIPVPKTNGNPEEPNDYKVYKASNGQLFDEVRIINTAGEMSVHNLVARNRSAFDKDDPLKDDNTYIITDNNFDTINDTKGWDILAVEGNAVIDFTANTAPANQPVVTVAQKAMNMELINLKEDTNKQEITLDYNAIKTISAEDALYVLGGDNDIVKLKGTSITHLEKDHTDDGIVYEHYQLNKTDGVVDLYVSQGTTVQEINDDGTPRSYDPTAEDNTVGYSNEVEFTYTDTGAGYDTLMFNPNDDITLDFDSISSKVNNIEEINMEDDGVTGDTLTIDAKDVLDMTDVDHELFIKGDSSDTVNLDNSEGQWQQVNSDHKGYDMYTSINDVTLYIDTEVTTHII